MWVIYNCSFNILSIFDRVGIQVKGAGRDNLGYENK